MITPLFIFPALVFFEFKAHHLTDFVHDAVGVKPVISIQVFCISDLREDVHHTVLSEYAAFS